MSTTRATTTKANKKQPQKHGISKSTPNPVLQALLFKMIKETSMLRVSMKMQIGREALSRFLTGLPMHTSTLRGIEATLRGDHLPEASENGLRR